MKFMHGLREQISCLAYHRIQCVYQMSSPVQSGYYRFSRKSLTSSFAAFVPPLSAACDGDVLDPSPPVVAGDEKHAWHVLATSLVAGQE